VEHVEGPDRGEEGSRRGERAAEVPSGVRVRRMVTADVDTVVGIESDAFSSPWSAETFKSLLGRPGLELLVLEDDEEGVIGYAVLWCILDQGELANVAVTRRMRGRGLGRHLLARVLDVARERGIDTVFLEVRASNRRAHELYRAFGFSDVGRRKAYYEHPREDAVIMAAKL
jgi:[ribosomal protein S18]-alanine N-acetyltransferase